jgi:hypothetical protein
MRAIKQGNTCAQTTGRRTRISRYDAENENCSGLNHPAQSNVSSPSMPPHSTHSPINVICCADRISRSFAPVHSALGPGHPPPHDACCPLTFTATERRQRDKALQMGGRRCFKGCCPRDLIVFHYSIIQDQPCEPWDRRGRVIEPCLARRPDMVELAERTYYLRANFWQLLKSRSIHFNAR